MLSHWLKKLLRLPHAPRRAVGARRGQSTLELAIILPVLATLTMGIIEMGLMLNSYILVVTLGREGARVAVDGALNQEIRTLLFLEGTRRIPTFGADAVVLIVRGRTANSDGTGGRWTVDPCNPSGWTLKARQSDVVGQGLDGVTGYEYVLVEVQFIHRTVTQLPFANDVPISTRSVIRTGATNTNEACP